VKVLLLWITIPVVVCTAQIVEVPNAQFELFTPDGRPSDWEAAGKVALIRNDGKVHPRNPGGGDYFLEFSGEGSISQWVSIKGDWGQYYVEAEIFGCQKDSKVILELNSEKFEWTTSGSRWEVASLPLPVQAPPMPPATAVVERLTIRSLSSSCVAVDNIVVRPYREGGRAVSVPTTPIPGPAPAVQPTPVKPPPSKPALPAWVDSDCNQYSLTQSGDSIVLKATSWKLSANKNYEISDLTLNGTVKAGAFHLRSGTERSFTFEGTMTDRYIAGIVKLMEESVPLVLVRTNSATQECHAGSVAGEPKKIEIKVEAPSGRPGSRMPTAVVQRDEQGRLVTSSQDHKGTLRSGDSVTDFWIRAGQTFTIVLVNLATEFQKINALVDGVGRAESKVSTCVDGPIAQAYLDTQTLRSAVESTIPVSVLFEDQDGHLRAAPVPTSVTLELLPGSVGKRKDGLNPVPAGECIFTADLTSDEAGTTVVQAKLDTPESKPSQRTFTWTYRITIALILAAAIAAVIVRWLTKSYQRYPIKVHELALAAALGALLYLGAALVSLTLGTGSALVNFYAAIFVGGCAGLFSVRESISHIRGFFNTLTKPPRKPKSAKS
jgi:hypothetical protein